MEVIFHAFLTFTFGLQVVLPEGSTDISVSAPFPVKQWQEVYQK